MTAETATENKASQKSMFYRNMIAMLDAAAAAGIPVVLTGNPGTGKTAFISEYTKSRSCKLTTLIGARLEPSDIQGFPRAVPREDGNGYVTDYCIPKWQHDALSEKNVVLFLDELSNTSNAVQAAMLSILQEREFPNGEKIPKETILIGAMNPPNSAADYNELALPTTNRMMIIPWNPTHADWYKGMLCAWGKEEKTCANEMRWREKIVSFIKDSPDMLHKMPETTFADEGSAQFAYNVASSDYATQDAYEKAWPSHRSWDNASKILGNMPSQTPTHVLDQILTGTVGIEAAIRFAEWRLANDSELTLEKALDESEIITWDEVPENDLLRLMLNVEGLMKSIGKGTRAVGDQDEAKKTAEKIYKLFESISGGGRPDQTAPYVTGLFNEIGDLLTQEQKMKIVQAHSKKTALENEQKSA